MIRILQSEDALRYRSLRLEALKRYPEHFGVGYEQQLSLDKLYFERIIEEQSNQGLMFGAFDGEQLVGICGVTFETERQLNSGEIIQMYVKPEYQNKGFGALLMNVLLSTCKSASLSALFLEVMPQNAQAIHLYRQIGFTQISHESAKGAPMLMSLTL
ncbi:GNAT family N-acetyltransferase [Reinekea marina]|uniref:GNAT family N-acetyltransferase n=1 Tax=Reinekea marina TaxID=1310421 RepID=A0ABV7WUT3_9GAMM|nr:GNAT family N-acetyltransferase [Reinekea marina]MDN3650150.1 GNAT family N-acetyltransferase [Reinekea marina]